MDKLTRLERLRVRDRLADFYFGPLPDTPETDPYLRERMLFDLRDHLLAERRFELWRLRHEQELAA